MFAILMFAAMVCGQAEAPATPMAITPAACATCDLLPVSEGWFGARLKVMDDLVAKNDAFSRGQILLMADQWALVRNVLPSAFNARFKEAYWEQMLTGLGEARQEVAWHFVRNALRVRDLFPDRVDQIGLTEDIYEKGVCELRQMRISDPGYLGYALANLEDAFPGRKADLEREFVFVGRPAVTIAEVQERWVRAERRTTCRCEWKDEDRIAYIEAFTNELRLLDTTVMFPDLPGDQRIRLRHRRDRLVDEIRLLLEQDRETWRHDGLRVAWFYYQALRGARALQLTDAILTK